MKPLKLLGLGIVALSLFGGAVATFIAMQDAKNVEGLGFMLVAGMSLLLFVGGLAMMWMSKKGDPFEEAVKVLTEDAESAEVKRPSTKSVANEAPVIPTATLSAMEQLMKNTEILEKNNAELASIIAQMENARRMANAPLEMQRDEERRAIISQMMEQPRQRNPQQLTFEEEMEQGKRAYYESLKPRTTPQPSSVQEANELARRMQNIPLTPMPMVVSPPPQEMIDRYRKAEMERQAAVQTALLQRAAGADRPLKVSSPGKVKVKFEIPFFGKKKPKLQSLLEAEEKKLEAEEEIARQKYGA